MKDCLPTDDQVFPLIYSVTTGDRFFRIHLPEPLGEIDGPAIDHHLFRAGTGTDWDEAEFDRAAERIYTLERALCVRHFARDRHMDQTVYANYQYPENWQNPLLGEPYALDPAAFAPVADEYYHHLGWDPESGWPTRHRMRHLGIGELYEPMVQGALKRQVVEGRPKVHVER